MQTLVRYLVPAFDGSKLSHGAVSTACGLPPGPANELDVSLVLNTSLPKWNSSAAFVRKTLVTVSSSRPSVRRATVSRECG
jgi:hypothetical protein